MKQNTVALVVPELDFGGGISSIVELLVRQLEGQSAFDYRLVSLATSSVDTASSRLGQPSSWLTGPGTLAGTWRGRSFIHVGCHLAEIEFMRYQPRRLLSRTLEDCDLIQVVSGFPAFANAVLGQGKPVCVWAATRALVERKRLLDSSSSAVNTLRRIMSHAVDFLDDRALRKADAVLVMNAWMEKYVQQVRRTDAQSIKYAPPGVDIGRLFPLDARKSCLNRSNNRYILSVGRFGDPRKNPEMLLKAFALMAGKIGNPPDLKFAGSTAPDRNFWLQVHALGLQEKVEFIPSPNDKELVDLYQNALCFAMSSDEEGFGMVLIEAMACGIPVISTRCGGPDNIVTDGEDGFLVPIGGAKEMSERLSYLCNDIDANVAMGRRARYKVESCFTKDRTGNIFFETWCSLLN